MSCTAIIVAAGRSERFGGELPKVFLPVAGKPVLAWTIGRFEDSGCISDIVLVVAEEYMERAADLVSDAGAAKVRRIVSGGQTRADSVRLGLQSLSHSTELVAIHDGARPLTSVDDIAAVVAAGKRSGAAILASRCTDALKVVRDGVIEKTLSKELHYLAQTPQVFTYELIRLAHERTSVNAPAADDAVLVEQSGTQVTVIEPRSPNPKITFGYDLLLIETLLTRGSYV